MILYLNHQKERGNEMYTAKNESSIRFYNKDNDVLVTINGSVFSAEWHPTITEGVESVPVLYDARINRSTNTMTLIAKDKSIIAEIHDPVFDESCEMPDEHIERINAKSTKN